VNESNKTPPRGPVSGLGELLALGLGAGEDWTQEELAGALREQMVVPVEFELAALTTPDAKALRTRITAQGLVLKSISDLLQHPRPPLEMLVMAKDYFKANTVRPNPGLPGQVARALYYTAVAAAWLRHHTRISSMSDAEVIAALNWVCRQPWASEEIRELATAAANDLSRNPQMEQP
jgi:hypothetical protein